MSRESIIDALVAQKTLTSKQIELLHAADNDKAFLEALIVIYEKKAVDYLSMTARTLKKNIPPISGENHDLVVIEHVIASTNSYIIATNKASLLLLSALMLKDKMPELAVSAGFSTMLPVPNADPKYFALSEQTKRCFTTYFARYKLSLALSTSDLQEICSAVEPESPELFPPYLLQSLLQQKAIGFAVEQSVSQAGNAGQDINAMWANELANGIRTYPQVFHTCLRGMLFYLGKELGKTNIVSEYKDVRFAHLQDDASLLQFVDSICRGFVLAATSEQTVLSLYRKNDENNQTDISRQCISTLPLLGISVTADNSAIQTRQDQLRSLLSSLQAHKNLVNTSADNAISQNRTTLENSIQNATNTIQEALRKQEQDVRAGIDKWRAEFKPNVTIGTSAAEYGGSRGPSFNF